MSARLHILPAKGAPVAAILRRKPSRCVHVLRWHTLTGELESGSWFRGKLYPLRADLSFDGEWLTYLALGSSGATWNGLCRLPWLKTIAEGPNKGTWYGGGYWASSDELRLNGWSPQAPVALPFRLTTYSAPYGEDEGVLYPRLERDGWRRVGPFGPMRPVSSASKVIAHCVNDPGWAWQWSPRHPVLRALYLGYLQHGRTFRFALGDHPSILDSDVQWACWDCTGSLLVARQGCIARYTIDDFRNGTPSFQASLESLVPSPPAA